MSIRPLATLALVLAVSLPATASEIAVSHKLSAVVSQPVMPLLKEDKMAKCEDAAAKVESYCVRACVDARHPQARGCRSIRD